MLKNLSTSLMLLIALCFITDLNAQQLTYKPINPAFGGDTFNYQWLLQSAEIQNKFTDPNAFANSDDQSNLDAFADGLNRQLLSQFSRALLNSQINLNDGLEPGTFSFGNLEVEILDGVDGLVVNILDTSTGDTTTVVIPNS
ncbi:curli production assembly/transport component CsgF [Nonlabens sp. Hel1_33_55]|uniref:curli production assembly/transport component CsgF n=1 Tax=Nonlabens sp. Hel1_33_55 TaxID=1336802 RepID=UPI000875B7E9|nr:curli production assembly/transport component CsgF [Nonlabens sp. Hel1_33_55]SCX97806.1 curli production assembly/transport component CsgF [Nonlabens sp. Hel1_33_55]